MLTKSLDGSTFAEMLLCGAMNIKANSAAIDDLNVFPVPDGDTGSNMCKTLENGIQNITDPEGMTIGEVADAFARGTLLGARGNSGVILSQIFKGIQTGLDGYEKVDAASLAKAYQEGIKQSYSAVSNPVEGTILTVFREGTEYASRMISPESSIEDFYRFHLEKARDTLSHTKEMLPALREADVIDSGGAGYVCIAEGMLEALSSGKPVEKILLSQPAAPAAPKTDFSAFSRDSLLQFGYCTELLLRLQSSKVDVDNFHIGRITDFLDSVGGQSVVAVKDQDIVKIHVHTMNPGIILNECQKYGEFLTVKVENMALQHEETLKLKNIQRKKCAVVAVSNGKGLSDVFRSLGADAIVDGGQTSNPSAGDFINAFSSIDAQNIIVFPNNSNILLTAEQAARLYDRAVVHVVHTRSMQQGYSAMSVLTPSFDDIGALISDLQEAADNVVSGEVAKAVRDAQIGGTDVRQGDYIAFFGKDEIIADEPDKLTALMDMLKAIEDIGDKEILTLFFGLDVSPEEAEEATARIGEEYPDLQLDVFNGQQEVYSFMVGIE